MQHNRRYLHLMSLVCACAFTSAAQAQVFPNKPIRIVTSEPGGAGDFISRMIAQGISAPLGMQVIVDNRGGSVVIPAEVAANAPADGCTLIVYGSTFWVGPLLEKMPYDPVRDFAPVALLTRSPNLVVVHPSLPVKSIADLVALARTKPGSLNYGSGATGAITHVAAELFNSMAHVKITRIPYKGAGPALNALVAGEVDLMFPTASSVSPHLKSGRVRPLAVTTRTPSALFPGLPTVAAVVPGYETASMEAIFTTARSPDAIIARLNQEIMRALNKPDVKEKLFNSGAEVASGTPDDLGAVVKAEIARTRKVIEDTGMRVQ